jgi:hypothetical protein
MNHMSVVINGITYYQQSNGHKKTSFCFNGNFFETEEEAWMAEMLFNNGIGFLHHINFVFCSKNNGCRPIIWCPDFVLAKPCLWTGPKELVESPFDNGLLTVGFEVKLTHLKGQPRRRARILFEELGIPILLINRSPLDSYYHHNGKTLPLQPIPAAF